MEEWWNMEVKGTKIFQVHKKLSILKEILKFWIWNNFKHIEKEKVEIRGDLNLIEAIIQSEGRS